MSNLPTVIGSSDMTESEVGKVKKFIDDGLPGIATVTDDKIHRMLDLYLNGSTYTQISNILEIKKIYVLYFAHKANWEQVRQEYLNEIQEKIKNRVVDSKIRSQDFMLLLVQTWQKKIGNKLKAYLATDNEGHMDDINLREIAQLMRAIEMLNELDGSGRDKNGKSPAVGLNLGNGVVVEKTGDNKISITPKESTVGDLLQKLADEKRNKENSAEKHDIQLSKGDIKNENKE
jgi:hypothetical protein